MDEFATVMNLSGWRLADKLDGPWKYLRGAEAGAFRPDFESCECTNADAVDFTYASFTAPSLLMRRVDGTLRNDGFRSDLRALLGSLVRLRTSLQAQFSIR